MPDIKILQEAYPLAPHWDAPEVFSAITEIGAWTINIAAWRTVHRETGEIVTGSAASTVGSPLFASFFNLLSRTATVDFVPSKNDRFYDSRGAVIDGVQVPLERRSPEPHVWRFARGSGVAGDSSAVMAQRLALFDLLERDRLLRSWYGEIRPDPRPYDGPILLKPLYRFRAFSFAAEQQPEVAGVFGYPTTDEAPFLCGFGVGDCWSAALAKAQDSCLQRLGFLWGENIPLGEIPFSPTPLYHQEVFLAKDGWQRIEGWLEGAHLNFGKPSRPWFDCENALFFDLTPAHLRGRWYVAGAFCEQAFPLFFGRCPKFVPDTMPEELWIHPVA